MDDGGSQRVSVTRRIEAPVERVFGLLADPARHPAIDGTGMLREGATNSVISGDGDAFTIKMHNDQMGDYEMTNHVVAYEVNRRVEWEPSLSAASRAEDESGIGTRLGHRWGYELVAAGPSATDVTEIFDCSGAPEWLREATDNGNLWMEGMAASLQRLDEQCTET
jgi:hypothetical protein